MAGLAVNQWSDEGLVRPEEARFEPLNYSCYVGRSRIGVVGARWTIRDRSTFNNSGIPASKPLPSTFNSLIDRPTRQRVERVVTGRRSRRLSVIVSIEFEPRFFSGILTCGCYNSGVVSGYLRTLSRP